MPSPLDKHTLWSRMRLLLERLVTSLDGQGFIDECVDVLLGVLGGQTGLVFLGRRAEEGHVVAMRRSGRSVADEARDAVDWAIVEDAIATGRSVHGAARVARASDPGGGSRRYALATPLHAAPLAQARRDRRAGPPGAVYIDFEADEDPVGPLHREFFEAAVVLLSAVIDQRERLDAMKESLRAAQVTDASARTAPTLDELLSPPSMTRIRQEVRSSVMSDAAVMILGESGTGKTELATAVAQASGRRPIVRATLGSSDDLNTITSELFGHERGAFSGAVSRRKGLVEYADGGTLILDEILNLPPAAQQLLLDFTQYGTYRPLGYDAPEPKRAQVRIISATNGNMNQAIADTRFRQDLYFRLAATTIVLPPLRARREDIPAIARRFLESIDPARGWEIAPDAQGLLASERFEWAGNIRELEGFVRRGRDRALASDPDATTLRPIHLLGESVTGLSSIPPAISPGSSPPEAASPSSAPPKEGPSEAIADPSVDPGERWSALGEARDALRSAEKEIIEAALARHYGVISHAARTLGLRRTSLLSRMETLGIDRDRFR